MSNSFQNESLQKQLEVARSRSAEARRRLTHHDPRRQPQGVIRLAGEPGHPIVGLGQPDRPTPADAKVEAATDLRGRSRVIRTPAVTYTVRADRHAEDLHRALRADDTRLQRYEWGEPSAGPGR